MLVGYRSLHDHIAHGPCPGRRRDRTLRRLGEHGLRSKRETKPDSLSREDVVGNLYPDSLTSEVDVAQSPSEFPRTSDRGNESVIDPLPASTASTSATEICGSRARRRARSSAREP